MAYSDKLKKFPTYTTYYKLCPDLRFCVLLCFGTEFLFTYISFAPNSNSMENSYRCNSSIALWSLKNLAHTTTTAIVADNEIAFLWNLNCDGKWSMKITLWDIAWARGACKVTLKDIGIFYINLLWTKAIQPVFIFSRAML